MDYYSKNHKLPTDKEIGFEFGITEIDVKYFKRAAQEVYSLDTPIKDDSETLLSDTIVAETSTEEDVISELNFQQLLNVMKNNLTEREYKILLMRSGFETGTSMTLEETGKIFGVTRERIRQIEAKARRKIIRKQQQYMEN